MNAEHYSPLDLTDPLLLSNSCTVVDGDPRVKRAAGEGGRKSLAAGVSTAEKLCLKWTPDLGQLPKLWAPRRKGDASASQKEQVQASINRLIRDHPFVSVLEYQHFRGLNPELLDIE